MLNDNTTTFDFLKEISKGNTYSLMHPPLKSGLAIMYLYQRMIEGAFPDNWFKEADINEAFRKIDSNNERSALEMNNKLISDLQDYFLMYDIDHQTYKLRDYAIEYCCHSFNTLKATFDPTRIEKICRGLREKLQVSDLNISDDWLRIDFNAFQPELRQQIGYLERQIDNSVAEMRRHLNTKNENIATILKEIDSRFDHIRKQNKELRAGFSEIDHIKRILETQSIGILSAHTGDEIYNTIYFFQEMKQNLSFIDNKLDRIQPKIKQLFNNLNKPLFNSRIEGFLDFIINNSKVKQKTLYLPTKLPSLELHSEVWNFIIFERKKDLFPQKAIKIHITTQDPEAKANAFLPFKEKLVQQEDVSQWILKIKDLLKTNLKIEFSKYFFEILGDGDMKNLSLAVAVAYQVVKIFDHHPKYDLLIIQDKKIRHKTKNISIWEMIIIHKEQQHGHF